MVFHLSAHAAQRVVERSRLTPEETVRLLNLDPRVFIGHQQEDNRVHLCLYSLQDARFYVAVGNARDGAIATVLTLAQFQWSHSRVPDDKLWRARRYVISDEGPERPLQVSAKVIRSDGRFKMMLLGKLDGFTIRKGVDALIEHPEFLDQVHELCKEKGVDFERVAMLVVRERSDDVGVLLPIELPGNKMLHQTRWTEP